MTKMRPITETCVPRPDMLSGGLTDYHFAAQLDKIVRDPKNYPIYGNPDEFFAITYPTNGLKMLLTKTFGRVTGAKGPNGENGMLRPTTSFGGGKTHGLTAVYHLAKGARPNDLNHFVDLLVLPKGPVQIAALVGDALDPIVGVTTHGFKTFSLWGEMGAQLSNHAAGVLKKNDAEKTSPGVLTIIEALNGEPAIVIIDELAQYLRHLNSSGSDAVKLMARQIPVFLKNLLSVAADPSNKLCVIITLAVGTTAFGHETSEIDELMNEVDNQQALEETKDILTRGMRATALITPAEDKEIAEILKRRLFESIDEKAAKIAAGEFRNLYEQVSSLEKLAGGADKPETYSEEIESSYPFHPELIRVLDKRLGTIPLFQRTRGALKLLAEVVAAMYAKESDSQVINVGDIDFSHTPVLKFLTDGLERPEFALVAEADFAGPASHAAAIDNGTFAGKPPYATRVASTVFIHSLELTSTAGAGRNDWIVGTLQPGDDIALLQKALDEAERHFWHLVFDGTRYRFTPEPNVNAIIESEKKNIANTQTSVLVNDLVSKAFPNDGNASSICFAAGPNDISDEPKLRVVVIHHDTLAVDPRASDSPPGIVVEMFDQSGSVGTPRRYRNSVVFVVAEVGRAIDDLKDRARAQIAADNLVADTSRMSQFGAEIRKKIETYQKNAVLGGRIAVTRCYKHVYYPSSDKSNNYLHHRDLPAQQQGDAKKSATQVVVQLLRDENKIREDALSASYLKSKAWPDTRPSISTKEIVDWFWTDHASPIFLTLPPFREALTNGVRNEGWVYHDTNTGKTTTATSMANLMIEFRNDTEVMTEAEATNRGLLVRKPTQDDLRTMQFKSPLSGAEIRRNLESLCGGEPTKGDVLELLATAVQANEYGWLVVTDVVPVSGARALTPSEITKKGLDTLFVVSRAYADAQAIEIPTRKVAQKTFSATGPAGKAMQEIVDLVADFSIKTISSISIKTQADEAKGTKDIELIVAALAMLPAHEISVHAELVAEFANWNPGGGLQISGSALRADFQKSWAHLSKALAGSSAVAGAITLKFQFAKPEDVNGQPIKQLAKIIRELAIQHVEIVAEVSKT